MKQYFPYNVEIEGQKMRLHYQADSNERVKSFMLAVIEDTIDFSGITFRCYMDEKGKDSINQEKKVS